jgi:hypothetical protein
MLPNAKDVHKICVIEYLHPCLYPIKNKNHKTEQSPKFYTTHKKTGCRD